ncbi:hypothetical protein HAHI6034_10385 [Hathewaya histolytica]|uniref:Uncharacterized protein n=1 Tax=Hathewaya histolytica TaxID=1498 RepID=A0A4U9R7U4_HATHI|nr:hypothetical protein [Hathewaya histolytica]VTQ86203.1 Uncharacterised protein [Hathewaya histolytica]
MFNISNIILSLIVMFIITVIVLISISRSIYKVQASLFIILGMVLQFVSFFTYKSVLHPISSILFISGIIIGKYGIHAKGSSKVPIIILISMFFLIQIIGYVFNIDLFKISTVSNNSTSYNFIGIIIPIALYLPIAYFLEKRYNN